MIQEELVCARGHHLDILIIVDRLQVVIDLLVQALQEALHQAILRGKDLAISQVNLVRKDRGHPDQ